MLAIFIAIFQNLKSLFVSKRKVGRPPKKVEGK